MKKGKNLVAMVLCLAMCYVPMQAAGYYESKRVQYSGVNVYYNGNYQGIGSQAVVIDGVTYLPVKALENMLGYNVEWNSATKTININGSNYNGATSNQAEIMAKNAEIAALRKELQSLKTEGVIANTSTSSSSTTTTSGNDITSSEISDTRRELYNRFRDYFSGVDFDFELSLNSSRIKVTVEIDNSSDLREFSRLSRSRVKGFLEEVCDFIRQRHDDILISGIVEYTRNRDDLYSFSYSRNDNFSFSEESGNDRYYNETDLMNTFNRTGSVRIDDYGYNVNIQNRNLSVSDNQETVHFSIYINIPEDMKTAWNNNTGTNYNSELRSSMRSIANELSRETDYEIYGEIYNQATSEKIGTYDYRYDEIWLRSV